MSKIELKVRRKSATNEYVVRVHIDGKYCEDPSYYTDCKDDAIDTARCMAMQYAEQGHAVLVRLARSRLEYFPCLIDYLMRCHEMERRTIAERDCPKDEKKCGETICCDDPDCEERKVKLKKLTAPALPEHARKRLQAKVATLRDETLRDWQDIAQARTPFGQ